MAIKHPLKHVTPARLTGLFVAVCGLVVMGAWLSHVPWLLFTSRDGMAMVFSTALSFMSAGVVLALLAVRSRAAFALRGVLCAVVAIVAGLALIENWSPFGLGIDLRTLHTWVRDQNPHPGRMAPNTAVAFLLVALALALRQRHTKGETRWAEYPLLASVITLGALGVVSNIVPLVLAYEWYRVPRMAIPTGAGFLFLGAALWFDRPRSSTSRGPFWPSRESRIYTFLGVALTLLLAIGAVSYGTIYALLDRAQWVEHSYAVRIQFDELISQYTRARLAAHSFLVDGTQAALPAFQAARVQLLRDLHATRELVRDNPRQEARLADLKPLFVQDISTFAAAIQTERNESPSRPQDILVDPRASKLNSIAIDRIARDFRDEEVRVLTSRERDSKTGFSTAIQVMIVGNATGLLILLYAFALLKRKNDQRRQLEVALQRANHELEDKVAARTRELATANQRLLDLNATLEERIAARTAELADLYDNAPCGYHSVNTDGIFVNMNATELSWIGYTREEVIGKMRHQDLLMPENRRRYQGTLAEFKESGVVNDVEFEYVRKDGSILSVSLRATAIRDAQGNFLRSRTSVYDITHSKRAEQEILQLNASLERHAGELHASNRELESFSYSVSHDLRAPLRAIDGFALMLQEDYGDQLDDEGKRLLSVIRDNTKKMSALIDDLLALSRLGRQEMVCVPVLMEPLVREVAQEAMAAEEATKAQIDIGPLPAVEGDRALLRQVWLNLIANALKYSSRVPEPHIEIGASREPSQIVYRVRDNGAGFDMQYSSKLFGVFQRLHRADEFRGTGVGLAIVRRLVERHGGRAWAEGKPNEGATFYFAIPAGGGANA